MPNLDNVGSLFEMQPLLCYGSAAKMLADAIEPGKDISTYDGHVRRIVLSEEGLASCPKYNGVSKGIDARRAGRADR